MLDVIFGRDFCKEDYVLDTRVYFKKHKKPEWFSDLFVQKFLKDIDKCEVLFEEALKDRWGHGISTEMISTGSKTLCCIYYDKENKLFYGSAMGDNCVPYLMEISRKKDVRIFLEHMMGITSEYFEEGLIRINGKVVSEKEYIEDYCKWTEYMMGSEIETSASNLYIEFEGKGISGGIQRINLGNKVIFLTGADSGVGRSRFFDFVCECMNDGSLTVKVPEGFTFDVIKRLSNLKIYLGDPYAILLIDDPCMMKGIEDIKDFKCVMIIIGRGLIYRFRGCDRLVGFLDVRWDESGEVEIVRNNN